MAKHSSKSKQKPKSAPKPKARGARARTVNFGHANQSLANMGEAQTTNSNN